MKERSIILRQDEVFAALQGAVTVVRPIKNLDGIWRKIEENYSSDRPYRPIMQDQYGDYHDIPSPFGSVGDRLWVRETWAIQSCGRLVPLTPDIWPDGWPIKRLRYPATDKPPYKGHWWNKRSSSTMPRWASRLTLENVGVSVERRGEQWVRVGEFRRVDK